MTVDVHGECRRQIEVLQHQMEILRRERDAAAQANQELRQALAELERAAGTDRLTGAWARRRFEEAAAAEISLARRGRNSVTLLMLDLDYFKAVNDRFGHPVGDAVLVRTAEVIRAQLRGSDALVRWGGEEFLVLAPATRLDGGMNLAEKIRKAIEATIYPKAGSLTVSIGVAQFEPDMDLDAWIFMVDEALYCAKAEGRNQVIAAHANLPRRRSQVPLEIVWDETCESGEPLLDEQHREFFRLANALLGASASRQPATEVALRLSRLVAHAAQHFQDEEALLDRVGYPGLSEHAESHRRLFARAVELQRLAGTGGLDLPRLVNFLVAELVQGHLMAEDVAFFPRLQSAGAGCP